MNKLRGVIPPIITPYDTDGSIHRAALRELVEWYVDAGCQGLWVCGGTGEGVILRPEERQRMAEWTMEAAAGRLKVAFHVGAVSTAEALEATAHCQRLGVDAISSVPPFFYGKSDSEVVDYFRRLGDATDRPLYLYNLPDATGRPLTAPLVAEILKRVPGVVGIKHSGTNLDLVVEMLRERSDLEVIIGRGELFLAGLTLGAVGLVCASVCMAPERFVRVYRAFLDGDLATCLETQRLATRVKELFLRYPVIACTKWVNAAQIGLECGPPREPLAAIATQDAAALGRQAQELELLEANWNIESRSRVTALGGVPR